MRYKELKNTVLCAMFIGIGLVLPFFTGQIKQFGSMLLPMHIPVILCGLICGWKYGMITGFVLPLLRTVLFAMPKIYPDAVAMAFELSSYGFFSGFLYERSPWQCVKSLYKCMIKAMLLCRVVWGIAMMILLGIANSHFTFKMFITGTLVNAIPGIILQLILIPAIMVSLKKAKLVPLFRKRDRDKNERVHSKNN